ncbi:MAG: diguanylate cyclase [Nitrospiraceae bacterium]|nr:diguanylate cyclase [Nitrospiraceae bacterium]
MEILIAEDDATSRLVLESTLTKRGYEVIAVSDGESALAVLLRDIPPRIALLDWEMPGLTGPEVCQRVRQRTDAVDQYIFLVILTGKRGLDETIEGLEAGADDYVKKPFNADELELRIRAGERIIGLQDQLVAAKQQLRRQAERDPLTGILNRGAIMERIKGELEHARRQSGVVGLGMMDLDHFKIVNDTHGHQAGDKVLCETVARVRESMREYDIFGRYGGEEFLLVIPTETPEQAPFERVRRLIAEKEMAVGSTAVNVTVSIGVAWGTADDGLERLLRLADEALYRAKEGGRNRVECAGSIPASENQ